MVLESWFGSFWRTTKKSASESEKLVIGVLTFEVSSLMSKVIHLWHCLSDKQVVRLREEIMNSQGVRKLVSDDDDFLVGLVSAEMLDNLGFMAKSVARLGKRCADPVWQRFEHVLDDLTNNDSDLYGWEFTWKKMDKKAKKMERFIALSTNLYQELEVLAELEQTLRRMQGNNDPNRTNLLEFQHKVVWQQQKVKNLREASLWNRTYDYTVRLLARSLFTIFGRIKHVFGIDQTIYVEGINGSEVLNADHLSRSYSIPALMQSSVHPSENSLARFSSGPLGRVTENSLARFSSGPLGRVTENSRAQFSSGPIGRQTTKSGPISSMSKTSNQQFQTSKSGQIFGTSKTSKRQWQKHDHSSTLHGKHLRSKPKRLANVGPFKGCMVGGNESPVLQSSTPISSGLPSSNGVYPGLLKEGKDANAEVLAHRNILHTNLSLFSSKRRLLNAPPATLGAAALGLHYANVIIVIEKLVASPHLIGPDARDDLYNMLPTTVRAALRTRLKSYSKSLTSSVYDTALAAEWSEALARILDWLAPLAHNMIRWQSARNFEQQHLVSRTNVLLVQTLYYADQAKTEAVITELLVGLNYIWRFGRELNAKALLECASSRIFDDYLDLKG